MGNDSADAVPGDGEGPARRVTLGAYAIAPATVTNREFADFVRATRYVTDAEQAGSSPLDSGLAEEAAGIVDKIAAN